MYHRLSILELSIPPLRNRKEDIPALTNHFIEQERGTLDGSQIHLSSEVLTLFKEYPWKGNVRELKNSIIFTMCCIDENEEVIRLAHVPPRMTKGQYPRKNSKTLPEVKTTLAEANATNERQTIIAALRQCGQNKSKAAKLLGIARSNLYTKMRLLGL